MVSRYRTHKNRRQAGGSGEGREGETAQRSQIFKTTMMLITFILASLVRRECLAKAVGDMIAAMGACESGRCGCGLRTSKQLTNLRHSIERTPVRPSGRVSLFFSSTALSGPTRNRLTLRSFSYCEPAYIDGQKNPRGERWVSGWNLKKRGLPSCSCDSTEIPSCLTASHRSDGGIDYRCAAHSDLCQLGEGETFGFVDIPSSDGNQSCGCRAYGTLHTGEGSAARFDPSKMTRYGACYLSHSASKLVGSTLPADADPHQSFCAYSPSDCPDYHTWIEPGSVNAVLGHDCGCQDTHVGGCVSGFTGIYCAVTQDDCQGPFGAFHKPFELKSKHNHSCKLCDRISMPSSSSSKSSSSKGFDSTSSIEDSRPASAAQESIIAAAYADEIDATKGSMSSGAVVAVVLGASSGLVLISLFAALICKKKNQKIVSSLSQVNDEERVFKTSSSPTESEEPRRQVKPRELNGCQGTNCDMCSESTKCGGSSLDW